MAATTTPTKSAFWSGSLVAGIVYNGMLFTSRCANLLVDGTLSAVEIAAGIVCGPVVQGGVSVARNLIRPTLEHASQAAIMGASLAAGIATGAVVYTVKSIRRERAEIVKDFPHEEQSEPHIDGDDDGCEEKEECGQEYPSAEGR